VTALLTHLSVELVVKPAPRSTACQLVEERAATGGTRLETGTARIAR
jgi:hypothetical protein